MASEMRLTTVLATVSAMVLGMRMATVLAMV